MAIEPVRRCKPRNACGLPTAPRLVMPVIAVIAWVAAAMAAEPGTDSPVVDTRGKLEIRSSDGDFRWRIDGRVHVDANWFRDSRGIDFGSGSHLRRARLGMNGRLWRHWEFKFQYDFTGSGRAGVQDAYMQYTGLGGTTLTIGHFKEPLSLEVVTGANNVSFVERSLPSVLAPGRNLGIAAQSRWHEKLAATVGLFGEGVAKLSDADDATKGLDEGWAVTARAVATPVRDDGRLVHLGAAASYRRANDHGGTPMGTPLRIRQRPEASVTSVRLLDTGDLADTEAIVTWGAEAAWVQGRFSLQGEHTTMTVERRTPGALNPTFRGYYVMGSWVLSGESRRYDAMSGTFSNPRVRRVAGMNGHGAWELLARYSRLDLNDRAGQPGGILGGDQTNAAVGLTWYPNDNLRFMLNYVKVLEMQGPGHDFDGVKPAIVLLRTQVIW